MRKLFILLFVLCILFVSEIALEWREHVRGYRSPLFPSQFEEQIVREGPPGIREGGFADWGDSSSETFPFRSRKLDMKNGTKANRIWIISSSMTEDIYLAPSEIWPNIADSILEGQGTGSYVILNAAKVGMDIDDGLRKLEKYYQNFRPDIVILYEMSNTINKNVQKIFKENRNEENWQETKNPVWGGMLRESVLLSKANGLVKPLLVGNKILEDSVGNEGKEFYISRLLECKRVCEALNIRLIICTFATKVGKNDCPLAIARSVSFCFNYNTYLSVAGWLATVRELNDEIREFGQTHDVKIIDLEKRITGKEELFRDYVHFSKKGHQEIGKTVALELLESRNRELSRK
jgi:hypothetical protein